MVVCEGPTSRPRSALSAFSPVLLFSVLPFSKINDLLLLDTLIQEIFLEIMKINNFRGDLNDSSANKEPLSVLADVSDRSPRNLLLLIITNESIGSKYSKNSKQC